jgi:hypothetical protein
LPFKCNLQRYNSVCRVLCMRGAHVVMACRSVSKGGTHAEVGLSVQVGTQSDPHRLKKAPEIQSDPSLEESAWFQPLHQKCDLLGFIKPLAFKCNFYTHPITHTRTHTHTLVPPTPR